MSDLIFVGQFVASKIGKVGLSVLVDVDRYTISDGSRTALVTGGSATEGRRGLYHYRLASADLSLYQYVATFITSDATVDQQELAAIGLVVPDALVSSRLAPATAGRTLEVSATGEASANVTYSAGVALTSRLAQLSDLPAAAPSAAVVADAVWDEALAGHAAAGSAGAALGAAGTAGDPWSADLPGNYEPGEAGYIIGRLADIDTSEVSLVTTNDAGELTITAAVTYAATVSGLTISGTWSKILLTIKRNVAQADASATIQVQKSTTSAGDGLLRINGAAPASPLAAASGSLTVNQSAGTVVIALVDEATAQLAPASGLLWDLKQIDAAGASTVLASGTCNIVATPTRTVS